MTAARNHPQRRRHEPQRYVKRRDLEAAGFDVVDATNGAEALRLLEEIKPPVVLLDVQLPDINGHDVCRYIKNKWPEVMVLMTSATFTTSEHRAQGLDAGADSYLVQPAEPLELAAAINALLRIRRSEDELRGLNATLDAQVKERGVELSRAINALKSSADRMRSLLQTTYIFQGYMTPDGTLLDANRASLEGIHATVDEVVGRPYWETPWFSATPGMPEDDPPSRRPGRGRGERPAIGRSQSARRRAHRSISRCARSRMSAARSSASCPKRSKPRSA